jgi:peptide/nickel transport system ATP-binding protein
MSPTLGTSLTIDRLTVKLPEWADRREAVRDVSIELARNEILCVVGESGSGKSMLARSVLGLLQAPHVRVASGRILYQGEDLLQATSGRMRQVRGRDIAMVFQEPMTALNPLMRIGQQIDEMIAVHLELSRAERYERIIRALTDVHLPDPERIYRAYPHEVSGGQRQRAMIAMALILDPSILIADEPTTALDVTTQAQILKLIKELQARRGTGVLFITHDFGVVAEIADRVAVMRRGELVEIGPAKQVLESPVHEYTRALLAAVPNGKPRDCADIDGPAVLKVRNLAKGYGHRGPGWFGKKSKVVQAVKSATLTVRRGETLGIVGESGSGKSTLGRCIGRLVDADSGEIRLGEIDITALSRQRMRPHRKRVQMIFQDPYTSLNPRMKTGQIIAHGPMVQGVARKDALARADELLALVGLDQSAAERFPHEFSGGQRQRIGIARALAMDPEILIADEPVSALDVSVQAQILKLLEDIRERFGLAMIFITHDLRVAAQVCDRLIVMSRGEIVEEGATRDIFSAPQHPYTQTLLAAIPGRSWLSGQDDPHRERSFDRLPAEQVP